MKRYCHYKQSLVLSHENDFSITIHPKKWTKTKLSFNKGFHQRFSAFICHEFADSNKHAQLSSYFFALRQNILIKT